MSRATLESAAVNIPNTEPASLRTGDTWAWTRTLADFPADASWVLKYTLINAAARISITTSASGQQHAVNVAASATANYVPGVYTWQAFVEKSAERYTVGTGSITVLAGYSTGSGNADARTAAQIALDAAVAAYAAFTASNGLTDTYTIAGRSMKFRSVQEIVRQINFWRNEVNREQAALGLQGALGTSRKILTRFGS